jgi:imidazoleglycerol phosphate dehydratase HisB
MHTADYGSAAAIAVCIGLAINQIRTDTDEINRMQHAEYRIQETGYMDLSLFPVFFFSC